jgi:cyclin-dependent kinase 8/11
VGIDQGETKRNPISGYTSKVRVREKYHIVGFISSGTYGRVYKAVGKDERQREYAIKKFVSLDLP